MSQGAMEGIIKFTKLQLLFYLSDCAYEHQIITLNFSGKSAPRLNGWKSFISVIEQVERLGKKVEANDEGKRRNIETHPIVMPH